MTGFTLSTSAVPYLHHATTTTRVRHGFFGTAGGVSSGVYASLNCGFGSGDDTALVAQNRDLVRTEMGLEPGRMAAVHQVHGRDAVMAEDLFDDTGALLERDSLPPRRRAGDRDCGDRTEHPDRRLPAPASCR